MPVKSIKVSILGRQYALRIEEDDEEMMLEMVEYVDRRFKQFKKQLTKQNETTVMVMATLSITEELFQLQKEAGGREAPDKSEYISGMNNALAELLDQIKETNNNAT